MSSEEYLSNMMPYIIFNRMLSNDITNQSIYEHSCSVSDVSLGWTEVSKQIKTPDKSRDAQAGSEVRPKVDLEIQLRFYGRTVTQPAMARAAQLRRDRSKEFKGPLKRQLLSVRNGLHRRWQARSGAKSVCRVQH